MTTAALLKDKVDGIQGRLQRLGQLGGLDARIVGKVEDDIASLNDRLDEIDEALAKKLGAVETRVMRSFVEPSQQSLL